MKTSAAAILFAMLFTTAQAYQQTGTKEHPIPPERRQELKQKLEATINQTTQQIKVSPENPGLYLARGDAEFFLGRFAESVTDYQKMIELKPETKNSHWQLGIAYFYANDFEAAAHQFESYHSFDNVDRENGIWRYLSQRKAFGAEKARADLLKYEKDDREPFPDLYRLFAGSIDARQVFEGINKAEVTSVERAKRLFYAHLYVGLNEWVEGRDESARLHLREAVRNTWAPTAGYGPAFMWHVGRLHFNMLLEKEAAPASDKPSPEVSSN